MENSHLGRCTNQGVSLVDPKTSPLSAMGTVTTAYNELILQAATGDPDSSTDPRSPLVSRAARAGSWILLVGSAACLRAITNPPTILWSSWPHIATASAARSAAEGDASGPGARVGGARAGCQEPATIFIPPLPSVFRQASATDGSSLFCPADPAGEGQHEVHAGVRSWLAPG